jgi:hypothetical protein
MSPKEVVSNDQIVRYIDIISSSFGVRENISKPLLKEMRKLFAAKQFSQCILKIKLFFNLPMTLRIGYLREKKSFPTANDFDPSNPDFLGGDCLNPFNLFCEPEKEPASVMMPSNLPSFVQPTFKDATITMYVRNSLRLESFETFAKCVGHEMAHIVLYATRHQLKGSEIATDLTAMILGFSEIYRKGRRSFHSRFGYLDDEQFRLAYQTIRKKQKGGFFRRFFGI